LDISWKEIGGISGIVAVISLFERYIVRYWNFSKQRKKLRIYNAFKDSQGPASPEEILKRLQHIGLEHDLESIKILVIVKDLTPIYSGVNEARDL
jgi:hypothetical protein